MSTNGTSLGINANEFEFSGANEENPSKNTRLTACQTNVGEKLEVSYSMTSQNKIRQSERVTTSQMPLQEVSNGVALSKEDLPESTRKLFEEYSSREKFKQELTREEFEKILSGKLRYLGEGQFGVVYESEDGKYALKIPKAGESISDDRLKNEVLKKNAEAFDSKQAYYQQKDNFIARYVGTFKTREGIEVVVFEKIDGEEFQKCVVKNPASLFRLLAQAATAIAIFNEAGCINSDIKPNNMMVTNDLYLLKLIDQGSAINLLQKKKKTSTPLSKQPLGSATPLKRGVTPRTGFKPKSDESPSTPSGAFFGPATPLVRFVPGSGESPAVPFEPSTPLARQPLGSATPLKRGVTPRTGLKPKSDESPLTSSGDFFGPATPLVRFVPRSGESPAVPFEPSTPLASFHPGSDESSSTRLSESIFIPTTPLARQPRGTATPLVKRFSSPNLVSGSESEELVSMTCTPSYAAPEVMMGFKTKNTELFTPAVDVYSLGVSILEKLKDINDVGTQGNIEEILVLLYKTFFISDFEYRNTVSNEIADWCEANIVIPKDRAGSKFIGLLLSDCLAFNPENRISAAQAAEILQVFSSYLEAKETNPGLKCPNYRDVKEKAIKDSPKGIPIAIRKMLYDADPNMQQEAISIIENLVRADASYTNTPSYGLALLLMEQSGDPSDITFEDWAKDGKNFEAIKQLKERIYIREKDHSEEQDIPVSEEIYGELSRLIANLSVPVATTPRIEMPEPNPGRPSEALSKPDPHTNLSDDSQNSTAIPDKKRTF